MPCSSDLVQLFSGGKTGCPSLLWSEYTLRKEQLRFLPQQIGEQIYFSKIIFKEKNDREGRHSGLWKWLSMLGCKCHSHFASSCSFSGLNKVQKWRCVWHHLYTSLLHRRNRGHLSGLRRLLDPQNDLVLRIPNACLAWSSNIWLYMEDPFPNFNFLNSFRKKMVPLWQVRTWVYTYFIIGIHLFP